MADVIMPQLGESIAEGTIVKWLKKVGDPIKRDEDLLVVSTDKVEAELLKQAPADKLTAFSNAMILHGRETCTAPTPRCTECVLYDVCAWPEKPKR